MNEHSAGRAGGPGVVAYALHAAGRGWPVFPLLPGGKTPAIRAAHPAGDPCRGECGRDGHGFHDATCDPDRIRAWWRARPRANYGISTGPAGLVVVDLDTGKGAPPAGRVLPDQGEAEPTPASVVDGANVLTWAAERGGNRVPWGETLSVATPSGGLHLYFAAPPGVEVRSSAGCSGGRISGLGWCVDVRAIGGYVVGPGSTAGHTTRQGQTDGYAAIFKGAAAPLPGWLLARLEAAGSVQSREDTTPCTGGAVGLRPGPVAGAPVQLGTTAEPTGSGVRSSVRFGVGSGVGAGVRSGSRYGAAALAAEVAAVGAARAGDSGGAGRNVTVNRAAYKLGRLVEACRLDPADVTGQLLAAAAAVGLPEREARTAIASGLAQGRANPRAPNTRPSSTPTIATRSATSTGGSA